MIKITYNSPVILSLMAICFISLSLGFLTNDHITNTFFTLYATSWLDPMQYVRMLSYIFGHANYSHFMNNILIMLITGPMIEEKYQSKGLLSMVGITALISAILQLVFFRHTGLLGISGIVFMLIILSSFVNVKKGTIPLTFILVVLLYIGNEVYNAVFAGNTNISYFTHIVGGFCGGLFGFWIHKK